MPSSLDTVVDSELTSARVAGKEYLTYAEFLRTLARTFPPGLLPRLTEAVSTSGGDGDGDSPLRKNRAQGVEDEGEEGEEEVELELELEEDVDMGGWLPLRGLMRGPCPLPPGLASATASSSTSVANAGGENGDTQTETTRRRTVGLREEVHPNVKQLMRVADLLRDARRVVELEVRSFFLPFRDQSTEECAYRVGLAACAVRGQFVVKGVEAAKPVAEIWATDASKGVVATAPPFEPTAARLHQQAPVDTLASIRVPRAMHDAEDDDAMTEHTSRTDDDILHDAFSFLN
ncbi:hypothetical protein DFH09DRAFT_1301313 [Mycena vulgaris]|nr:hypothetical protein DFH09DRAFT_1301313 [Mycena vulgaris]